MAIGAELEDIYILEEAYANWNLAHSFIINESIARSTGYRIGLARCVMEEDEAQ